MINYDYAVSETTQELRNMTEYGVNGLDGNDNLILEKACELMAAMARRIQELEGRDG